MFSRIKCLSFEETLSVFSWENCIVELPGPNSSDLSRKYMVAGKSGGNFIVQLLQVSSQAPVLPSRWIVSYHQLANTGLCQKIFHLQKDLLTQRTSWSEISSTSRDHRETARVMPAEGVKAAVY